MWRIVGYKDNKIVIFTRIFRWFSLGLFRIFQKLQREHPHLTFCFRNEKDYINRRNSEQDKTRQENDNPKTSYFLESLDNGKIW